jgi:hypothetical protein
MAIFGTYTLPLVLGVQELYGKIYSKRLIPGGTLAKVKVCGTIGSEYRVSGLILAGEPTSISTQIAELKALADGTARSLDFQDGSDPVTCLMVDPIFQRSGKPNQMPYEALFIQSA